PPRPFGGAASHSCWLTSPTQWMLPVTGSITRQEFDETLAPAGGRSAPAFSALIAADTAFQASTRDKLPAVPAMLKIWSSRFRKISVSFAFSCSIEAMDVPLSKRTETV